MLAKLALFNLLFSLSLFAGSINIAVAANVSYAIDSLKAEFKKTHPDTKVLVTLGSSGKLTAQIKNGAPYQIFMSANMKYPKALFSDGLALSKPLVYAQGGLAFFSTKKQDFSKSLGLLKDEKIGKIAIANPKTAPYGKAAFEAMTKYGVYNDVKSKLVFAESASQTLSYTMLAADIGFIAKSSLYSPKLTKYKQNTNWIDVDTKLYTPIDQGIVLLKNAKDNAEAVAFYEFILGVKAKQIFKDFGYTLP